MILVTGGAGNVGANVVRQLLEAGEKVRVITRNPSSRSFPDQDEVVPGDLTRPVTLPAALSKHRRRNRSPLAFFLLVFALSIPIWLVEPRDWPITASVGVPFVAALVLAYGEGGIAGTGKLLRRVFEHVKVEPQSWYVPTIFLMPMIFALT